MPTMNNTAPETPEARTKREARNAKARETARARREATTATPAADVTVTASETELPTPLATRAPPHQVTQAALDADLAIEEAQAHDAAQVEAELVAEHGDAPVEAAHADPVPVERPSKRDVRRMSAMVRAYKYRVASVEYSEADDDFVAKLKPNWQSARGSDVVVSGTLDGLQSEIRACVRRAQHAEQATANDAPVGPETEALNSAHEFSLYSVGKDATGRIVLDRNVRVWTTTGSYTLRDETIPTDFGAYKSAASRRAAQATCDARNAAVVRPADVPMLIASPDRSGAAG